jgi:flavin-dependent dehydrogenase
VCLMSDVDIIRHLDAHRQSWSALLQQSGLMDEIAFSTTEGKRQVLPCETSVLEDVTGAGWVAVGDAASVFDPLASAGVMKALQTGRVAADGVLEYLDQGTAKSLNAYARNVSRDFEHYMSVRRVQYSGERRWRDQLFWNRRRH